MSTILLIPKKGYDHRQDDFNKILGAAERAAKSKTHFVITIDPEEYDVFAAPGVLQKVYSDESGSIRVNLTMFDMDG